MFTLLRVIEAVHLFLPGALLVLELCVVHGDIISAVYVRRLLVFGAN